MSYSSDFAATATRLLKKYGQSVAVTRYSMGNEDVTTGVIAPSETTSLETGVLLDFEYRTFGQGGMPAEAIARDNKRLLLTVVTLLKVGDQVEVDGEHYKIVVIKLINPTGTRILYDLWIQK